MSGEKANRSLARSIRLGERRQSPDDPIESKSGPEQYEAPRQHPDVPRANPAPRDPPGEANSWSAAHTTPKRIDAIPRTISNHVGGSVFASIHRA